MKGFFEKSANRVWSSAVGWSFALTALRIGGNLLLLPLLLTLLPTEELGLWYTFLAMGQVVTFFDLGFGAVFIRYFGYIKAGATEFKAKGLPSVTAVEEVNRQLFHRLVEAGRFLYLVLGILWLLTVGLGGWFYIGHVAFGIEETQPFQLIWVIYTLGIAFGLINAVWATALQGLGYVREGIMMALVGLALNYALSVGGLLCGLGLWAPVLGVTAQGIWNRSAPLFLLKKLVPAQMLNAPGPRANGALIQLWSQAWRYGLVAAGAFFILHANVIICTTRLGLEAAAQYAFISQLIALLAGISSAWFDTKIPKINALQARGESSELLKLVVRSVRFALATFLVGWIAILLIGKPVLFLITPKASMLEVNLLVACGLVWLLQSHHGYFANVVLSTNENPFVFPALLSGVMIALLNWYLAPLHGVLGIIIGQGVVQLAFNNWWPVFLGLRSLKISPPCYLATLFLLRR